VVEVVERPPASVVEGQQALHGSHAVLENLNCRRVAWLDPDHVPESEQGEDHAVEDVRCGPRRELLIRGPAAISIQDAAPAGSVARTWKGRAGRWRGTSRRTCTARPASAPKGPNPVPWRMAREGAAGRPPPRPAHTSSRPPPGARRTNLPGAGSAAGPRRATSSSKWKSWLPPRISSASSNIAAKAGTLHVVGVADIA
jgi:hypothetical protein